METRESTYPLRRLRQESEIPVKEVIRLGRLLTPYFPKSREHLYVMETRGTTNYHIISAYAAIFNAPVGVVAALAEPASSKTKS